MKFEKGLRTSNKQIIAIAYMIMSAFFFSAMQLAVKLTGTGTPFPIMEQVFFRNIIALLLLLPAALKKGAPYVRKDIQKFLFGRSIAGFLSIITFFYATNHAKIADANILNKLSPVIVTLLSVLFLQERISWIQVITLFLSFGGAWVVCSPEINSAPLAMIAALLSALFSGIAYTFLSALKTKTDPSVVILHFSTLSVVCAGVCMLPNFVLPTLEQFGTLLLIGLFGSLGQVCITFAYKMAPATQISIYNYTGIIWSGLLGKIFLDETVVISSIIGGGVIMIASIIDFIFEFNRGKRTKCE